MRDGRLATLQNGIAPRTDLHYNGSSRRHEEYEGHEVFLVKNDFVNFETFESS